MLKVLEGSSFSLEDLKNQEAHLPPEDSMYQFFSHLKEDCFLFGLRISRLFSAYAESESSLWIEPFLIESFLNQVWSSQSPPVGDAWLDISPQELERLLEEKGSRRVSDGTRKTAQPHEEVQEEEAGYSLIAVTQGMKNFINAMSSHEGAEIPR